ncbi:MAG TPA: trypsin-like serine protease [Bryobacteraceae bacterium]|nr:trypsin-like serine protease [Bryobacteraceae bacterium]
MVTKFLCLAAATGLVALLAPLRLAAITYGFADTQNAFSNVGAFIVVGPSGRIYPICSGTLIAPAVFLTASHCTVYFTQTLAPRGYTAAVSFDNTIPFGELTTNKTKLIEAVEVVTNPAYNQAQSDSGDIAVLLLRRSPNGTTPATLPPADLLDRLAAQNGLKGTIFTAVGYGVQNRVVGGGVPYFQDINPIPRMYAFSSFDSLNAGYIRLSQNPATGNGGTCSGDSGGPNFMNVNGTRILAAITITGDTVCRSTNVDYRLDTQSARAFLAPFVALP